MSETKHPSPLKIVRPRECARIIGVAESTLWKMRQRGDFPPARKFGGGLSGWSEAEVYEWMISRPREEVPAHA